MAETKVYGGGAIGVVNPGDRLITLPTTANSGYVQMSGATTSTSWGGGKDTGTRSFLLGGHKPRIRKAGTVAQIFYNLSGTANLTSLQWKVFRWDGAAYDEVGASEVVAAGSLSTGGATHTLATPITDVLPGDFLAVVIIASGNFISFRGGSAEDAEDYILHYDESDVSGDGQTFASSLAGYSFACYVKMAPPILIGIGDSFMGGSSGFVSFLDSVPAAEAWTDQDLESQILYWLYNFNSSLIYANHAKGGSDSDDWASTGSDYVTSRCIDYTPRAAAISLGFNDIMGSISWATYEANLRDIVQNLQANCIVPIMITILHDQDGTAALQSTIRKWNTDLKEWCDKRGILLVDAWQILSSTSDEDVRDTTVFGSDGHPNKAGYKAIATGLTSRIRI